MRATALAAAPGRLASGPAPSIVPVQAGTGIGLGPIDARCMLAAVELIARDLAGGVACVMVGQGSLPAMHQGARRLGPRARRSPTRIAIGRMPGAALTSPQLVAAVSAIETLVEGHMALLTARSTVEWRALDAVRQEGSRRDAAATLGCSRQAVDQAVRRSGDHVTGQTEGAISAILDLVAHSVSPES